MICRVRLDIALQKELDYLVPPELVSHVTVGSRVKVPLGGRQVLAHVVDVINESDRSDLRPILRVIGHTNLITPKVLKLAEWIANYYCCPVETALKSVLPEAVRKEKEGWKKQLWVQLIVLEGAVIPLTNRQQVIIDYLRQEKHVAVQTLLKALHTTLDTLRRLEDHGLITITPQITERDPYLLEHIIPTKPLEVNDEQKVALKQILDAIDRRQQLSKLDTNEGNAQGTFLLHGVTGSGKTEVYLQAIARSLELGLGAIVLVPEISLTPQTVERFKARFCSGPLKTLVAVLHSHLSSGERHDEWHKIRQGRARIVIGARSAIFAPVDPLGLIIVDEEHEHSYKQEEAPRYHARDVAVVRGQMERAVVVLGSATPSMESYYNVQKGKYQLLELNARADDKKMPIVRVIDMRQEARKEKGIPIFSVMLKEAITRRLELHEQTILFLNRRGYSSSLQCPLCGYVAGCPNCSISLTFHRGEGKLCCHLCGHEEPAPLLCPEPECRNPQIRYAGIGTEKVEEALNKLFPHASIRRMDSDTLKKKEDYRKILSDFRTGKIDILLGTQMIAKGLHFPNVTLVGIIYADLSLHVPDFRSGERTFQLLTQVAGRAGRGDVEGEVIVQSFTPFHSAIQYARRHDYNGFFEQEIEWRSELKYPPLSRIMLITFKGRNEEKVQFVAQFIKREIEKNITNFQDLMITGPAPAPVLKVESFYRHHLMVRTRSMSQLSRSIATLMASQRFPEGVGVVVDIDPVDLM